MQLLKINRVLWCIDTHTECDPTRILISGLPPLPKVSMHDKKEFFTEHLDHVRRFLMHEPRGHKDMFGAVITDTIEENCDFGVLFMDPEGYLDFCGHGIIAVTTVMLEMNGLKPKEAGVIRVDTPAGIVKARPIQGKSLSVAVESVPSFLVETDFKIHTSSGVVPVDIAFGGNFFAFVKASDLKLEIEEKNLPKLTALCMEIKRELNKRKWEHPEIPDINTVELIEVLDKPRNPEAQVLTMLVYGNGQVARDPCASGTCAKVGLEVAKGKLKLGGSIICEGILGTTYTGKALRAVRVGAQEAVIPEIIGRSFVTGLLQFILDEKDPLPSGWLIR